MHERGTDVKQKHTVSVTRYKYAIDCRLPLHKGGTGMK